MTDKPIVKPDVQYLLNNIYDDIKALQSSVLDQNTINRLVTLADTAVTRNDIVTSTQNGVCTPEMLNKINSMAMFPFKHVQCFSFYLPSGTTYLDIDKAFTKPFPSLFILINGVNTQKSGTTSDSVFLYMLRVNSTSSYIINTSFELVSTYKIKVTAISNMPYISMFVAEV